MSLSQTAKAAVEAFWNDAACGESAYAHGRDLESRLRAQAAARYSLEPYILEFANFEQGRGKEILEIGVGMGADHERWALAHPLRLSGVDLTERAVAFTSERLKISGLTSELLKADAESLPFDDGSFDLVYSWGVLHHSPDTSKAFTEAARVLRRGGKALVMIYHKWSLVGLMLWARYSIASRSMLTMKTVYSLYMESPGTKAYTLKEATQMCKDAGFIDISVRVQLSHGDLLQGAVGQRHQGRLLRLAKIFWPRQAIKLIVPRLGTYLLIEARK